MMVVAAKTVAETELMAREYAVRNSIFLAVFADRGVSSMDLHENQASLNFMSCESWRGARVVGTMI